MKKKRKNGNIVCKLLVRRISGAEAKNISKKESFTEKKSNAKKKQKQLKTIDGKIISKKAVQETNIKAQPQIPISNKMKLLIQEKFAKKKKEQPSKEQIKFNKEFILKRGIMIRRMNLTKPRNSITSKIDIRRSSIQSVTSTSKQNFQELEAKRRAKLGLTFIDLKNKYLKTEKSKSIRLKDKGNKVKDLTEHKKLNKGKQEKKTLHPSDKVNKVTTIKATKKLIIKLPYDNKSKVKKKEERPNYIQYLIPKKKHHKKYNSIELDYKKTIPDTQLMNNIKIKLLSEITSLQGSIKTSTNDTKDNRIKKLKPDVTPHSSKSTINAKPINKEQKKVELTIHPNTKITDTTLKTIEVQIQTDTCKEEVNIKAPKEFKSSSLREMRLMLPSEKKLESSVHKLLEPPLNKKERESLFDKNTFNDFTLNKLREMIKTNNASAIIEIREKVVKHKESNDKKYIHKMYKAKKITPKEYQRKRKEIEKWVNKEKEEIKKTKSSLLESWKKAEEMIEDANNNALQLRKLLIAHTISYTSDAISNLSLLDSQRAATDRYYNKEIKVFDEELDKDFRRLYDSEDDKPIPECIKVPIRTKDDWDSEVKSRNVEAEEKDSVPMSFMEVGSGVATVNDKEIIVNDIMEQIYAQLIEETFNKSIPKRPGKPKESKKAPLEVLSTMKSEGIRTDQFYINKYIDDLFLELNSKRENYLKEINSSIKKPPLEALRELQSSEGSLTTMQLSQDIDPILPLSIYLEVEKKYEAKIAGEGVLIKCMHAHNRAIFDSVNEALNLIRPYGLSGEPMPWSNQGRVLFRDITDKNIIIRNIKNIVLDWVSFEVGTLPNPEFLFNGKFDEEYFIEIRERQLAILLAQEVVDNEDLWLNYDMEEAEIEVDITDMALESLVTECIQTLVQNEKTKKTLLQLILK